jgi:hypothetical protein
MIAGGIRGGFEVTMGALASRLCPRRGDLRPAGWDRLFEPGVNAWY